MITALVEVTRITIFFFQHLKTKIHRAANPTQRYQSEILWLQALEVPPSEEQYLAKCPSTEKQCLHQKPRCHKLTIFIKNLKQINDLNEFLNEKNKIV